MDCYINDVSEVNKIKNFPQQGDIEYHLTGFDEQNHPESSQMKG